MKDTRSWRTEPTKSLQRSNGLNKDQIEALLDIELGLFAIEKLGLQSELDSATTLWLLISNRFFLFPALEKQIETSEAKHNLFNLRQLLHYLTNQDIVEQSLKTYRQIPAKYSAYDLDDGYQFLLENRSYLQFGAIGSSVLKIYSALNSNTALVRSN